MSEEVDVGPARRPQELVSEAEFSAWLAEGAGALPWVADPLVMPEVARVDEWGGASGVGAAVAAPAGVVFGGEDEEFAARVCNWVLVDDLGGLGELWCGSFAGRFFLRCTAPAAELQGGEGAEPEVAVGAALEGEELGMTPVADSAEIGALRLDAGCPVLPRRVCPMAQRERLLMVEGKWRRDLPWDTLVNGCLSHMPPYEGCGFEVPFRYLTLRLVQVGEWLCFHSQVTAPRVEAVYREDVVQGRVFSHFVWESGERYAIGQSQFDGLPFAEADGGADDPSRFWHAWSAEPPWGTDQANAWAGEDEAVLVAAGACGAEAVACPGVGVDAAGVPDGGSVAGGGRCGVFPRLHIGEGHVSPYLVWQLSRVTMSAQEVEDAALQVLAQYWNGGDAAWMEEFLGVDNLVHWEVRSEDAPSPAHPLSAYVNLQPQVAPTRVFTAHIEMAAGGRLFLALFAANPSPEALLVASACCPYDYWHPAT